MAGGSGAGSVIVRPTASPRLIKLVQVGDWGGGGSGGGRLCADGFMLCCRGREHLFLLRVLLVYCPSYYKWLVALVSLVHRAKLVVLPVSR